MTCHPEDECACYYCLHILYCSSSQLFIWLLNYCVADLAKSIYCWDETEDRGVKVNLVELTSGLSFCIWEQARDAVSRAEVVVLLSITHLLCCRTLTEDDIRTAIKNSGGVKGSLLIPDAPFELLVRRSITQLLVPALQCKDFVHGELMRIAGQCAPTDITRFPALQVSFATRLVISYCNIKIWYKVSRMLVCCVEMRWCKRKILSP